MESTTTAKAALRREVRRRAAALSPEERRESDGALFARFLALPQVAEAKRVLLFYGVGTEPDTKRLLEPLWAMGKELYLPRCLPRRGMAFHLYQKGDRLAAGAYGIPEPEEDAPALVPTEGDLMLVPNLCCDRRGHRLGQGGGYYDRRLAQWAGSTAALCRECLLREEVPTGPFDRPVDVVVTEGGLTPLSGHEDKKRAGPFGPA